MHCIVECIFFSLQCVHSIYACMSNTHYILRAVCDVCRWDLTLFLLLCIFTGRCDSAVSPSGQRSWFLLERSGSLWVSGAHYGSQQVTAHFTPSADLSSASCARSNGVACPASLPDLTNTPSSCEAEVLQKARCLTACFYHVRLHISLISLFACAWHGC